MLAQFFGLAVRMAESEAKVEKQRTTSLGLHVMYIP